MSWQSYFVFDSNEAETASRQTLEQALDWFEQTPEGKALLDEMLVIKDKPIRINTNQEGEIVYNLYEHRLEIDVQSASSGEVTFKTIEGGLGHINLKRAIAHECFHSKEQRDADSAHQFYRKVLLAQSHAHDEIHESAINEVIRTIDAKGGIDDSVTACIDDIFDRYFGRNLVRVWEKVYPTFLNDVDLLDFLKEYEGPAIKFENEMAAKYDLGPVSLPGYLERESGEHIPSEVASTRKSFRRIAKQALEERQGAGESAWQFRTQANRGPSRGNNRA